MTFFAFADDHKAPNGGLLSSEAFDLDGKLDMYVEKEVHVVLVFQNTYPALGTAVYVLSGKSQSKSTGDWKT